VTDTEEKQLALGYDSLRVVCIRNDRQIPADNWTHTPSNAHFPILHIFFNRHCYKESATVLYGGQALSPKQSV